MHACGRSGGALCLGAILVVVLPGRPVAADPPLAQEKADEAPAGELEPDLVELVAAHNRERSAEDLPPLVANPKLNAAARVQARDMAEHKKMSHEGSDGSKFNERIERQGYHGRRVGENVARGMRTVPAVMRSWMNSPHHKENILGEYGEVGVARAFDSEKVPYWCVVFGLQPPRPVAGDAVSGLVQALNRVRTEAKKSPLKVNRLLTATAQKRAEEMAAGKEGNGLAPAERARQAGYAFLKLGEAEATGQDNGDEVVKTWLASPEHRDYFLGDFTELGVGFAQDKKGVAQWAIYLGRPRR